MKSGVFDLREKISAQLNGGSKKIEPEPRLSLDIPSERGRIDESPPIRFRIEWAGCQGLVTASWQLAHLNFQVFSTMPSAWLNKIAKELGSEPELVRENEWSRTYKLGKMQFHESKFLDDGLQITFADFLAKWSEMDLGDRLFFAQDYAAKS